MDRIGRLVAEAVIGIDTLWGGDVLCASGTGRFIADSWFSDEGLPTAYTLAAAAKIRQGAGSPGRSWTGRLLRHIWQRSTSRVRQRICDSRERRSTGHGGLT